MLTLLRGRQSKIRATVEKTHLRGLQVRLFVCMKGCNRNFLLTYGGDVGSLPSFWGTDGLIRDRLTFAQRLKAVHRDRRIVDKHVHAILRLDKSVALCIIEPFDFSCCRIHYSSPTVPVSRVNTVPR